MAPSTPESAPISSSRSLAKLLIQPVEIDGGGLLGQRRERPADARGQPARGEQGERPWRRPARPGTSGRGCAAARSASRAIGSREAAPNPPFAVRSASRSTNGSASVGHVCGRSRPRHTWGARIGDLQPQIAIAGQVGAEPALEPGAAREREPPARDAERVESSEHHDGGVRRCAPAPARRPGRRTRARAGSSELHPIELVPEVS